MHGVQALHAKMVLSGWLMQTPKPLTAVQISSARSVVAAAGGILETKSGELDLSQITNGATAIGILIALAVVAMSVGLIRSESASDLRTLAATGASSLTRRTITSATAGALALLGAGLGSAVAIAAVVAWAPSALGATFALVPWADVLVILVGLPVAATWSDCCSRAVSPRSSRGRRWSKRVRRTARAASRSRWKNSELMLVTPVAGLERGLELRLTRSTASR